MTAPPAWTAEQLVMCHDGPLAHCWFTAEDWRARVEAARYMHEDRGQRRQPALDYVRTARRLQHPTQPAAAAVLAYRPAS